MPDGQIQWEKQDNGVQATLNLTCNSDGSIHMTSSEVDQTYTNPQAASQGLVTLFEQGIQLARTSA